VTRISTFDQGFTYASKDEVDIEGPLREQMMSVLGNETWHICTLADDWSIGGPGYDYIIKKDDTEPPLGHALMVKYNTKFVAVLKVAETEDQSEDFDQGFTLALKNEVESGGSLREDMETVLGDCTWHICQLENNCSIGGPGYDFVMKEGDTEPYGHALMVKYSNINMEGQSEEPKIFVAEMKIFETKFKSLLLATQQGFRMATKNEVCPEGSLRKKMIDELGNHTWHICELANNCSIGGPGYEYKMEEGVTEPLGHALMVKYTPEE